MIQPKCMTLAEIASETLNNPVMSRIIKRIESDDWRPIADKVEFCPFYAVRSELSLAESNIVLQQTRIVLPTTLQDRAIQTVHEVHQGQTRTKQLLRTKVSFPHMDSKVDNVVRKCIACQCSVPQAKMEPFHMFALPKSVCTELCLDFCGPLLSGEYLLILLNEYSRFPVVEIVNSTAAITVIPVVDKILTNYGIADVIQTNNGPPFNRDVWK